MGSAALLPGCAGTKEEKTKGEQNMKAKKIVALVLALVMVLALGTTALAATGDMSNPVTAADQGCGRQDLLHLLYHPQG